MMSSLLVDIGNTNIKSGMCSDGEIQAHKDFSTVCGDLAEVFEQNWLSDGERPERVLVSNVSDVAIVDALATFSAIHFNVDIEVIRPFKSYKGMTTQYDDPHRLGVDRWLVSLAAWLKSSGDVCVVDVGTALTVDIVTSQGVHLGGLIAPGPSLMKASLLSGTADLECDSFVQVEHFATNTADAISLGCLSSFGGVFNEVETRLQGLGLHDVNWYLTGGGAEAVVAQMRAPFTLVPELVLEGLAQIL